MSVERRDGWYPIAWSGKQWEVGRYDSANDEWWRDKYSPLRVPPPHIGPRISMPDEQPKADEPTQEQRPDLKRAADFDWCDVPASVKQYVESLEADNRSLEDNCRAKDVALAEIYRDCGNVLDGDAAQYDPQLFVQSVRAYNRSLREDQRRLDYLQSMVDPDKQAANDGFALQNIELRMCNNATVREALDAARTKAKAPA